MVTAVLVVIVAVLLLVAIVGSGWVWSQLDGLPTDGPTDWFVMGSAIMLAMASVLGLATWIVFGLTALVQR
jgi:uncharacterized membrane protein